MKRADINCKYKSKEHVKERDVDNKRNTRHSTKTAQRAINVDGTIKAMQKKPAKKSCKYDHLKYLREQGA